MVAPWATAEDLTRRLIAAVGRIPLHRVLAGALDESDWTRIGEAVGLLAGSPLFISALRYQGPEIIERSIVDAGPGVGLVAVDSLPALYPPHRRGTRSVVARQLKEIALTRGLAMLVTTGVESTSEGQAPVLTDLRGVGDLEDVADIVVLVHRDELLNPRSTRPGEADLIVARNANGPTGTVTATFLGHYGRLVSGVPEIGTASPVHLVRPAAPSGSRPMPSPHED
jgi:replicative DNA helicase